MTFKSSLIICNLQTTCIRYFNYHYFIGQVSDRVPQIREETLIRRMIMLQDFASTSIVGRTQLFPLTECNPGHPYPTSQPINVSSDGTSENASTILPLLPLRHCHPVSHDLPRLYESVIVDDEINRMHLPPLWASGFACCFNHCSDSQTTSDRQSRKDHLDRLERVAYPHGCLRLQVFL